MARRGPEASGDSLAIESDKQKLLKEGLAIADRAVYEKGDSDSVKKALRAFAEEKMGDSDEAKSFAEEILQEYMTKGFTPEPAEGGNKNSKLSKPPKLRERKGRGDHEQREPQVDLPGEVVKVFENASDATAAITKVQELVAGQTDDLKKATEVFLNVTRFAKSHFEGMPDGTVSESVLAAVSAAVAEAEKQYAEEHDISDSETSSEVIREGIIDILKERRGDKVKDSNKILEQIFTYVDTLGLSEEEGASKVIEALNLYQERYMEQEGKKTPLAIITGLTHRVEQILNDIRNPKSEEEDSFSRAAKDLKRDPKPRVELLPEEEGEDEPSEESEVYEEALSEIGQDAEDAEDFDDALKIINKGVKKWSKKLEDGSADTLREKLVESAADFFFESDKEKMGEEKAKELRSERVRNASQTLNEKTEKAQKDLLDAVVKSSPELVAEVEAEQKPISLNQAELDKNLQPNKGNDPKDSSEDSIIDITKSGVLGEEPKPPRSGAPSKKDPEASASKSENKSSRLFEKKGYANVDEFLVEQMGSEAEWSKKLDEWAGKAEKTESVKSGTPTESKNLRSAAFEAGLNEEDIDFLEWGNSPDAAQYLTPGETARLKSLQERVGVVSEKDTSKADKNEVKDQKDEEFRAEFAKRGVEDVTNEELAAFKKARANETLSEEDRKHLDSVARKTKRANLKQEYLTKARANGYEPVDADVEGYIRAEMDPESLKNLGPEDLEYIRDNIYAKLNTKNPALGGQENVVELKEQNEKLRKLREGIDRSNQTTFERAKGLGESFEQKAREWGDWYRSQPWYKKLGLAATSIGLGFGASFVGGSMGSLMGAGALALNGAMRTLSAFSTYSFVEGALRGKYTDEDGEDQRSGLHKGVHKVMAGTLAFLNASGLTGKAIAKVGSPVFKSIKEWILDKMGGGVGGGGEVGGGLAEGAKKVGRGLKDKFQAEGEGAIERGAKAAGKEIKKAALGSHAEDAAKEAKKAVVKKAADSFGPGSAGFDAQLGKAQDQIGELLKDTGTEGKMSKITLDRIYDDPAKMLKQAKQLMKDARGALEAGDFQTARGLAAKANEMINSDIPEKLEALKDAKDSARDFVVEKGADIRESIRSQAVEAATRAEAPAPDMNDVDAMKFGGVVRNVSEQAIQAKNNKIAESLGAVQWDRVKDLSADKILVEGRRRWWSGMTVVGRTARLMQRVMSETGVRPEAGESVDHFMGRAYEQSS